MQESWKCCGIEHYIVIVNGGVGDFPIILLRVGYRIAVAVLNGREYLCKKV